MARRRPSHRFEELLDGATEAFIAAGGYHRTKMVDIARRVGIAPGTLYLYVESKAALFDFLIHNVDAHEPLSVPASLPIVSRGFRETLALLRRRVGAMRLDGLWDATAGPPADGWGEIEAIVREMYRLHSRHRRLFRLLDQCARDYPDLAKVYLGETRPRNLKKFGAYLRERIDQGVFVAVPSVELMARSLVEASYFWAVSERWDRHPLPHGDQEREDLLVHMALSALVPPGRRRPAPKSR